MEKPVIIVSSSFLCAGDSSKPWNLTKSSQQIYEVGYFYALLTDGKTKTQIIDFPKSHSWKVVEVEFELMVSITFLSLCFCGEN